MHECHKSVSFYLRSLSVLRKTKKNLLKKEEELEVLKTEGVIFRELVMQVIEELACQD